jgi:RNA recognition motif-containing protein
VENQVPGPVILVTITDIKYPVNAEVLFSIFNRFGEVLRAIIFEKVQGLQAMVEMADTEQAQKAITEMNG